MKVAILIAAALVIFTSVPIRVSAQQASAAAQQSSAVSAAGSQLSASGSGDATAGRGAAQLSGSASASDEMRPVNAELVGKLDSKSAKVGDQVIMKTTESVKAADGTVIPKGTRLVGHLTSVSAHAKGNADSAMGIEFDHAELKGGQSLAIRSEIRSVAPPASAAAMSSAMESGDSLTGPMGSASGGARAMGGGRLGSGGVVGSDAVGGTARSTLGGAANAAGHGGATLGADAENGAGAAGHLAGQTAAGFGGRDGVAVNGAGSAGIHATGVRGVMLAGDASGKASGTLSAAHQNVHLDGGTQMVLGVSAVR